MRRPPNDNIDLAADETGKTPGKPAAAPGGTKLNGARHHINGSEHDWKPDEIEALHDSGKAATAPKPKRMLPKAVFELATKANLRAGLLRVELDCMLRAVVDLRLQRRHYAVLAGLILATNKDQGTTYAGMTYLTLLTGYDPETIWVILSDLRKWGYIYSSKFAREPGKPAVSNHGFLQPSKEEIRAFITAARLGKVAQEKLKDRFGDRSVEMTDLMLLDKDGSPDLTPHDKDSPEPDPSDLMAEHKNEKLSLCFVGAVLKSETPQPIENAQCGSGTSLELEEKKERRKDDGADAPPLPLDEDATPPHEAQPRQPIKPATKKAPAMAAEVRVAFDLYVEMAKRCDLAVPRKPGPWQAEIAARLGEAGQDGWKEMLAAVEASAFLCGENDRRFRADLDWLSKPKNFHKVLSGKYAGGKRRKPTFPSRW